MATIIWKGDAQPIAQVVTCTVGGTIDSTDVFRLTIGSKTLSVTAGSSAAATVATNIVAAWTALSTTTYPEFAGISAAATSGGSFTLTGPVGVPFTVTLSTTEADGSPATSQTFTQTTTTAASGPKFWSTAANWIGGVVPATGDDVVLQNSAADILYGLSNSGVTLGSLTIEQSFTGTIGLPRTNAGGYVEYRAQYLAIGATQITIGRGDGAGSGRIKIDTGSVQTTINVINSGSPIETGLKAILWKGTHSANAVNVNKGSFAAAVFADETATIAALRQGFRTNAAGDADVRCGRGVTLTTITKTGGNLEVNSGFTTLTHSAGEMIVADGAAGTMSISGGAVRYRSSGGFTTANVSDSGELDFRQDLRARSGTNCNLYSGATLRDPGKTLTVANGFVLNGQLADVTLDLGANFTLQRS